MSKANKYLYGWKLYVNYGSCWQYETFEYLYEAYRENKQAYRENCQYPQRWSRGRELNTEGITKSQLRDQARVARQRRRDQAQAATGETG